MRFHFIYLALQGIYLYNKITLYYKTLKEVTVIVVYTDAEGHIGWLLTGNH